MNKFSHSKFKDTHKSGAKPNLFELCRAKVSKEKSKIRINQEQSQIYLNFCFLLGEKIRIVRLIYSE